MYLPYILAYGSRPSSWTKNMTKKLQPIHEVYTVLFSKKNLYELYETYLYQSHATH